LCGAFVAIGVYLFRLLSPQDFLPVSVLYGDTKPHCHNENGTLRSFDNAIIGQREEYALFLLATT